MFYEYKCTNCAQFFEQPKNGIYGGFFYQCFKNKLEGLQLGHNLYKHYF